MIIEKIVAAGKNLEWPLLGALAFMVIMGASTFFFVPQPSHKGEVSELYLRAEEKRAYTEAIELAAVYGDYVAGLARLNMEIEEIGSDSTSPADIFATAKLTIFKADILLRYGLEYADGFALLGGVYTNPLYPDQVRSEALVVAMAHAFQGMDEGALTISEVQRYVFQNEHFRDTLNVGIADAMLIDEPLETYPYFAKGFTAAMGLNPTEKIYVLADSYALRLSSPFVVDPSVGEYYHIFIDTAKQLESNLDHMVLERTNPNLPYQEFIATGYYNLIRAYEALPPGDADLVEHMSRVHDKLAAYVDQNNETSFGANAYLVSASARIACKAVDTAGFNPAAISVEKIQPYLDEVYESDGWVAPCPEAFEFIADAIDTRFAVYF